MKDTIDKRNTIQKSKVESIVMNATNHPTADFIYDEAKNDIPSISLGTVYRILSRLVEEGKVRRICMSDSPDRYDKTTCTHAHFVCQQCGKIEDIMLDEDVFPIGKLAKGDIVNDMDVVFKGICLDCINKQQNK